MKILCSLVLLTACGAAGESLAIEEEAERSEERAVVGPTPFPREAALPAAPSSVLEIDMTALRETSVYERFREELDGDDPSEVLGRRVLERAGRVRLGTYGEERELVLIAEGPLEGVMGEVVAEIGDGRARPAQVERSGFDAFVIEDNLVAAQTAPDTVVFSYPHYVDEVLRTASGAAPATPLPPEMRVLLDRPAFVGAPMWVIFRATEREASDPLGALVADARFAGVAGRIEGGHVVAIGTAQASSAARATQLAADIERFSRDTTDENVDSPGLGAAIRDARVRTDDRWVEVTLRFPIDDLEAFMRILGPLGAI